MYKPRTEGDGEQAYLEAREQVPESELIARMQAAPDMGGALLQELSEFVLKRDKE